MVVNFFFSSQLLEDDGFVRALPLSECKERNKTDNPSAPKGGMGGRHAATTQGFYTNERGKKNFILKTHKKIDIRTFLPPSSIRSSVLRQSPGACFVFVMGGSLFLKHKPQASLTATGTTKGADWRGLAHTPAHHRSLSDSVILRQCTPHRAQCRSPRTLARSPSATPRRCGGRQRSAAVRRRKYLASQLGASFEF